MQLIREYIPLADKNWFKTGGPARYYAAPVNAEEFSEAIQYAAINNHTICLLGSGANALISDDGFDGLVIHPQLTYIHAHTLPNTDTVLVTAGAGVLLPELIAYCLKNNIGGLEEFSGIPGSIGGSVFINVHYFEFLISHFLIYATIIDARTGSIMTVDNAWFNFGYNYSTLHENTHYLVDATFNLKKLTDTDSAYASGRSVEIIRHRTARYPSERTCGSFFRNFYPEEVSLESAGKKMIYVAYYLDKIGVKGALSCGKAIVSYQHANMIVAQPGATTTDIINLVKMMQEKVQHSFGLIPKPECRLIGFKKYPLLK